MNNIYVDGELPENCKECSFKWLVTCGALNESVFEYMVHETSPKHCPVKPLSVRLAEERKRVIHDIDCELYTKMVVYGDTPSYTDIHSILNKIKENSV